MADNTERARLLQRVQNLHTNERNGYGPGDCHCDECVETVDQLRKADALAAELEAVKKERDDLLEARKFLPTSSIELLHETLKERGFADFAASIETFLGSTGAAYSAIAYHEERERAEAAEKRVAELLQFVRSARPLLGMNVKGSLGHRAEELLAASDELLAEETPE